MPDRRAFVRSLLTLRDSKESGVLTVKTGAGTTFVYLREGVPIFAEEGTSGETLGRMLLRQKAITHEQYVDILSKMTDVLVLNEQLRFGEVAVELGYLTEEQTRAALHDQVRWKIIRILQQPELEWAFEPSLARLEEVGHYPMQFEALVLDAVRWIDDDEKMEMGVRAAADLHVAMDEKTASRLARRFQLGPEEEAYLRRIDGRTIRALLDAGDTVVDVPALLTALVATRAIELVRAAKPTTSAAPPSSSHWPVAASAAPRPLARPVTPIVVVAPPLPPRISEVPRPPTPATPFVPTRPAAPAAPPPIARPPTPASLPPMRPPAASDPLLVAERPAVPAQATPPRKALPTRASTLLKALASQKIERKEDRAPASAHEAKLLAETALQLGLGHIRSGRYEQALPHLQRALQLAPQSDEYKLYVKWCALRARSNEPPHKVERAELDRLAHAAVKADPNFAFGSYVSGEMALHEGDDARARRLLKQALKLDPTLLDAQRQLRIVERRLGEGGGEKKKLW